VLIDDKGNDRGGDFIVDYRTRKNTKCMMLCTFASRDFYFYQKGILLYSYEVKTLFFRENPD